MTDKSTHDKAWVTVSNAIRNGLHSPVPKVPEMIASDVMEALASNGIIMMTAREFAGYLAEARGEKR